MRSQRRADDDQLIREVVERLRTTECAMRRTRELLMFALECSYLNTSLPRNGSYHERVVKFEMNLIKIALTYTHGSQKEAARMLGLDPTTLSNKVKRYKILPNRFKQE